MRISIDEGAALLLRGEVIAIPTETVYGLAAVYSQVEAVGKIYTLKKRPADNPLILHVEGIESVAPFVNEFPPFFKKLAKEFWPGPLTLVIPVNKKSIPSIVRANLPTQAFRAPSLALVRELIKRTGPLVAPSANLSGKPSATAAIHVEEDFGEVFPVLDGGASLLGVESTILLFQEGKWVLGRLGAISAEEFFPILGYVPKSLSKRGTPLCPGQNYRHYAPIAKLHLTKKITQKMPIIGYSDRVYPRGGRVFILGSSIRPDEVLQNLYGVLRQLDLEGVVEAVVDMDVPQTGLWATFHERITKAAKH